MTMLQEPKIPTTNQFFHTLGVLLLLDSPPNLRFGIDNISWQIGHKFKGIKLVPLGTHIIAYSLEDEGYNFTISKFMHFTQEKRILVYRWDSRVGQFAQVKGQQAQGYRDGVKQYYFDAYLGPYPQEHIQFWRKTTGYISQVVLDKLDPIETMGTMMEEYGDKKEKEDVEGELGRMNIDEEEEGEGEGEEQEESQEEQKQSKNKNSKGKDTSSGKFQSLPGTIYYSTIPRTLSSQPSATTFLNLDKTPILLRLLLKQHKGNCSSFLGELQYSFVHFVIGQSEESLQQWKKLVEVVVMSEGAYLAVRDVAKMEEYLGKDREKLKVKVDLGRLVMDFVVVLYDQLSQFPPDFFRDQISKDNFLCKLLKRMKQYSIGEEYDKKVRLRLAKLLKMIRERFNYQVELEDEDEEKPVVVEGNQRYF